MDVLTRNAVTLHGPEGARPVVLLHGFGCDQGMWRRVLPALAADSRVVLLDAVGAGASDLSAYDPVRHGSLQGYADDLVEVLDELALGPAVLVGHSVSAMVAALVAADRPDLVDRLVLVGPSPRYVDDEGYRGGFSRADVDELLDTMDSNYLGWSRSLAPAIVGNADRPELGEELTGSFCRTDPDIARRFARVTFLSDNRADLARVGAPALVVQCREDVLAPLEVGRYVAEHLPAGELVVLEATGHCPHLSAPEELLGAVTPFLSRS